MSNISRALRLAAAAQRVSMENADEAVQGQPGELNEQELANVAAKAAADVAADAAEKAKAAAGGESTETAEPAAAETTESTEVTESTETTDVPAATDEVPAGEEAAPAEVTETAEVPAGDEPPAVEEVPAAEEAAATDEVATDAPATTEDAAADDAQAEEAAEVAAIETPAEAELEELTADAAAEGDAAVADAPVEGEVPAETQTEEAGITDGDLAAAADTGEVAAAAVEEAVAADTGAVEDTAAAEVPAEGAVEEAAPAADVVADEPAAAEPAPVESAPVEAATETTEEQAPAAAPGPQTDTNEAVQEVVNLTEAIAEAATAEDVVKQARQINDGLKEVAETAEVVNDNGGVTMESLAMMQLALRPHTKVLERSDINLGVSLESFAGQPHGARLKVSVEEIRDVIAELDQSQPYLERQAVESLDRVVDALKDAVPSAVDRLKAVISQAQAAPDTNEGAPVKIGDGLSAALCVNGAFPTDLANELQTYSLLGNCLMGNYSDAAFRSAKQASLLVNAIDFSSATAFWEKVGAIVDGAADPRTTLTATQLESCLPGGASLFAEAQPELESPNAVLKKLIAFNNSHAPLEAMVAGKCEGDAEATAPALSASKIVLVAKALLEALCCDRINEKLAEGQKLWPEAQDSIRHLRENLANAPREIDQSIGADFSQLIKYVEVNYSLATWPLVNFLANAVLTVNAFVVFADRSLKAKTEELPAVDHTDEVVEDAAPAADAAIAEGAEAPVVEDVALEAVDAGIYNAAKLQAAYAEINELKGKLSKAEAEIKKLKAGKK